MTDEEYFESRCPYTDNPCRNDWQCQDCEIEKEEREWMEELRQEEDMTKHDYN